MRSGQRRLSSDKRGVMTNRSVGGGGRGEEGGRGVDIGETLSPGLTGRGEIAGWWAMVTSGWTLGHVWKVQNTRLICSYFIQDCLQDTNMSVGITQDCLEVQDTNLSECLEVHDTTLSAGTELQVCNLKVQDTR